jgi:plastocyanin
VRMLAGLAVGSILLFAAACGGTNPDSNGPGDSGGGQGQLPTACSDQAATGGAQISMVSPHSLDPADVTINAGESVTWTNNTTSPHTVSFDGGLDCGYVLIGKSVSVQFDSPGSYHYVDKIVPQYMSGTVTVQ